MPQSTNSRLVSARKFDSLVCQIQAAWYLPGSAPYGRDLMSYKEDAGGLLEVPGRISPQETFDALFENFAPSTNPEEAALQDFSLLEAQQAGLETRAFERFPLTDEEVCVRHFHKNIQAAVAEFVAARG